MAPIAGQLLVYWLLTCADILWMLIWFGTAAILLIASPNSSSLASTLVPTCSHLRYSLFAVLLWCVILIISSYIYRTHLSSHNNDSHPSPDWFPICGIMISTWVYLVICISVLFLMHISWHLCVNDTGLYIHSVLLISCQLRMIIQLILDFMVISGEYHLPCCPWQSRIRPDPAHIDSTIDMDILELESVGLPNEQIELIPTYTISHSHVQPTPSSTQQSALDQTFPQQQDDDISPSNQQSIPMEVDVPSAPIRRRSQQLAHVPTSTPLTPSLPPTASISCGICLIDFIVADRVKMLPCPSHHVFHVTCITAWLRRHATCPFDRVALKTLITPDADVNLNPASDHDTLDVESV